MLRKKSVFSNLLLTFIAILVIPIIAIILIANEMYTRSLINNVSQKAQQNTEQIALYLNDSLQKVYSSLETINSNGEIIKLADDIYKRKSKEESIQYLQSVGKIDEKLENIINFPEMLVSAVFYYKDGGYFHYGSNLTNGDGLIRDTSWYKYTLLNPTSIIPSRIPSVAVSEQKGRFYTAFSINPNLNESNVEMISIIVNEDFFKAVYEKSRQTKTDGLIVADYNGNVMTSNMFKENLASVPQTLFRDIVQTKNGYVVREYNGTRYIVTYSSISTNDWILINFMDYKTLAGENTRIFIFLIVGLAFLLLAFAFFAVKFAIEIIRPVNELVGAMSKLEQGDFDTDLRTEWGSSEFNRLTASFVSMAKQIKTLIYEIDVKEKTKRKLEIKALQYQINPHFVKNTLNSIRLLAMISQMDNISKMSQGLSNIISSSIEDDSIYTMVGREISLLGDYIYIMQIRYRDAFMVNFAIANEMLEHRMLKNILQPIVENSIFHGVSSRKSDGELQITGFIQDGSLVFEILDNGKGITHEKLEEIQNQVDNTASKSIGLFNVMERIRLNYGEKYKPIIESVPDQFTKITIKLPILESLEEEWVNDDV